MVLASKSPTAVSCNDYPNSTITGLLHLIKLREIQRVHTPIPNCLRPDCGRRLPTWRSLHWICSMYGPARNVGSSQTLQMLTPGHGDDGLGLIIRGGFPHPRFQHGVANAGFVSSMMTFENGDGAAIMTNGARGGQLGDETMHSIAVEYDWPDGLTETRQRRR
jgi:hypothetical protein